MRKDVLFLIQNLRRAITGPRAVILTTLIFAGFIVYLVTTPWS